MNLITHIAFASDWQHAQQVGQYQHPSLIAEGFIHCSTPTQVLATAQRFFPAPQPPLVLLTIDPAQLTAALKYELADNGLAYPHLYGPLNLDAVSQIDPFDADAHGHYTFPEPLNV